MAEAVLLSGATGFLGSAVAEELLRNTPVTIYALVRPKAGRTPEQRLDALWYERPELHEAIGTRIIAVAGDMERPHLGMATERYDKLAQQVNAIIHTAAEVSVNQTEQRLWSANVSGTYHMLEFAKRAQELGGLARFVHVSTAYVAGQMQGEVPERIFGNERFNSLYEQSKHEAELLVSSYCDVLPCTIVRPSLIVGDSRTGFVAAFNTLYYPLKRYLMGGMRIIPASPELTVNLVPVDYVAHLVRRAALATELPSGSVLHAVGQAGELPKLGELIEAVRTWAREELQLELAEPIYLPLAGLAQLGRVRNLMPSAAPKRKSVLRNLLALAPYFLENRTYASTNARALATVPFPAWRELLPKLLGYAVRRGFLDYTDRTVAEQILMRLRPEASTHFTYYDVNAEGAVAHEGTAVRAEILRIAQALLAQGAGPGTRIATLGVNSVRYMALDAAIGLVGAVHVPIYYTSPVADVAALVAASGASLIFVGTDRMLDALDLAQLGCTVVAMSNREDLREGIVSWADFIGQGAPEGGDLAAPLPYVPLGQTATIRYTSGTTGTPKGVVFTQQQIRWMGEVMPAVLDWKTRTSGSLRYLSFLPMSHVVEGILVAYAPYYILGNIEMYYLNDFPRLAEVLPLVRPNIFFSVPRFYEKVWNQFAATDAGKLWTGLPEGPFKRLLAHPLRYLVLRKAGLDRCRQLIVGSAPISLELLEAFRSLGVEIHNAFGVTEAPLITLSPLGRNELGSVGKLLPETEARLDDEGLVYVRGPQVTRGYDGMDEPVLDAQGWLCTGDLGRWSEGGNLVLDGRKKEILVTSYGKNIAPQKIELLLKALDGVSEAMVVADAQPYTTALVWLEDGVDAEAFDFSALDAGVRAANAQLSHPEQVKRWAVCARPLTVAAGELTPNLKLRRTEVAEARASVVAQLYAAWDGLPEAGAEVLHWGAA